MNTTRRVRPGATLLVRFFWCVGSLFFLIGGPGVHRLSAQETEASRTGVGAAEGKTVLSIEISGNRKIPDVVAKQNMQTKAGRPFSEEIWGEDVRALYNLGFWNVRRELVSRDDGVELRITVLENPYVRRVVFRGVSKSYEKELTETLSIAEGAFLSEFSLNLLVKDAVEFYKDKGHHFVEIDYELEKAEREDWVAIIQVEEGPRVKVDEILVEGNVNLDEDRILDAMETQESGLFKKGSFVRKTLDQDVVAIRVLYRHSSFLDARVDVEDLLFTPDKSKVTIFLRVEEGPSYRIRSLGFEGVEAFSQAQLDEMMRLKVGQKYLYEDVRRDQSTLVNRYDELAYIAAEVVPRPTFDVEKSEIDLVFAIKENRRYRVGSIDIRGNLLTRDKVIRRAITLSPGDPFSINQLRRSRNRLQASGYFDFQEGIEIETPPRRDLAELAEGEEDVQDVSVRVREGRTGELRFAAGIGSDSGFIGQVSITKKNFDIGDWPERLSDVFEGKAFVGGGQSLFLDLSPGTRISRFRLGFREPSVFGSVNSFGADIYRRVRGFRRYDVERTGFELSTGRVFEQFEDDVGVELSFRNELIDLTNIDIGFFDADLDGRVEPGETTQRVPDNVLADEGKSRLIGLKGNLRWESVDHPLTPTDGHSLNLTLEYTGNFLGGDIGMTRAILEGKRFFPIYETLDERRHVLALRNTLGWSQANDGTDLVPVYERFFAGGIATLRGFEFRSVGPQEFDEPTGGEALLVNGLEYSFPLYERIFRGVFFVDGGLVAENLDDLDLNEYRTSVGAGLQFFIPFLGPTPFTIYFGFPIRKEDTDDRQVVTFTLGQLGF